MNFINKFTKLYKNDQINNQNNNNNNNNIKNLLELGGEKKEEIKEEENEEEINKDEELIIEDKEYKINQINNETDNSIIFFKVWRCAFIRHKILNFIKLYHLNDNYKEFSIKSLNKYKYKYYLLSIILYFDEVDYKNNLEDSDDEYDPNESKEINEVKRNVKIEQIIKDYNKQNNLTINNTNSNKIIKNQLKKIEHLQEQRKKVKSIEDLNDIVLNLPTNIIKLELRNFINQFIVVHDHVKHLKISMITKLLPYQFPENLYELDLGDLYDHTLEKDDLPRGLKKLKLGKNYNKLFKKESFPRGLESLVLGFEYNQPIGANVLPSRLKYFEGGYSFNKSIDNLPDSVETIIMKCQFNQPITKLPNSLKTIQFGENYTRSDLLSKKAILPDGLKKLSFGGQFNTSINCKFLPNTLTSLKFGSSFNFSISEPLPSSLEKLIFGFNYKRPIQPSILNNGLKILKFDYSFNSILEKNVLPTTLELIQFGESFNQVLSKDVLPNGIKVLLLGDEFNSLIESFPSELEVLKFGYRFNNSKSIENLTKQSKSLKILKFGKQFNQSVNLNGLEKLEKLKFSNDFNKSIPSNRYPKNLKHFSCDQLFNLKEIPRESIVKLKFGNGFKKQLTENDLKGFHQLNYIKLGDHYNSTLDCNVLPEIQHLKFGSFFNRSLLNDSLPLSLTCLDLGHEFSQTILPGQLTNCINLKIIYFSSKYLKEILPGSLPDSIHTIQVNGNGSPIFPNENCLPKSLVSLYIFSNNNRFFLLNNNINLNFIKIIKYRKEKKYYFKNLNNINLFYS